MCAGCPEVMRVLSLPTGPGGQAFPQVAVQLCLAMMAWAPLPAPLTHQSQSGGGGGAPVVISIGSSAQYEDRGAEDDDDEDTEEDDEEDEGEDAGPAVARAGREGLCRLTRALGRAHVLPVALRLVEANLRVTHTTTHGALPAAVAALDYR